MTKSAVVTDARETFYDSKWWIAWAEVENSHTATLYYAKDDVPDIGEEIEVTYGTGGWVQAE